MFIKRPFYLLLGGAGIVIIAIAIYFLFFAGSGYVEGRPTFKYFRLDT